MSPDQLTKLEAMGIQVWLERKESPPIPEQSGPNSGLPPSIGIPRIRISAGTGDWLIIPPEPLPPGSELLLKDIQATLGASRCRFGQWANDPGAGSAPEELAAQGIHQVLALVPCRGWPEQSDVALVSCADLAELAASAEARRALWSALRPMLEARHGGES